MRILVAAALVLVLAGCSGQGGANPADSAAPLPAAAGDPAPSADPADLPDPSELAAGWTTDTSPEEDHPAAEGPARAAGPESWMSARDPEELVWGLAPLGCPAAQGAAAYPRPDSAMQGRYRTAGDTHAVALRLQFGDAAGAAQLIELMASDARTCTGAPPNDPNTYARQYSIASATGDTLTMSFTEHGPGAVASTWHVLGARVQDRVALLFVEQGPGGTVQLPDPAVLLADSDG